MAKDFYKSNYGINKNSKGIVYRYADGSVLEITFEKIAAGNPSFTKEDFDKIKELSDKFYHEEAKADCNYHHHVTGSYDNVEDSVWLAPESLEDELMKRADEAEFSNKIRDAIATMLTATEKRRFLLYAFRGLTTREIAQREETSHIAVWKSICNAQKKIKKFLRIS